MENYAELISNGLGCRSGEVPDSYRVLIRRSKTDQTGEGQEIAIPRGFRLRPVEGKEEEAVQSWLEAAGIVEGPLFRRITTRRLHGRSKPATELVGADALTGHSVALAVKRHCRRARQSSVATVSPRSMGPSLTSATSWHGSHSA